MTSTQHVRSFVHLHVHSTYSLGTGLVSPHGICREAKRAGYTAVAITDVCSTFGFVEFHRAAVEVGITPIYGVLIEVDYGSDNSVRAPLMLIALERAGLRNVCAAASTAAMRREASQPCVLSDISGFAQGVVAIAGHGGKVVVDDTRHWLASVRDAFGDGVYAQFRIDDESADTFAALARELSVPPVLTQDIRFAGRDRSEELDLLSEVREHSADMSVYGLTRESDSTIHNMLTPEAISAYYGRSPEGYTNAALIASRVDGDLLVDMGATEVASDLTLLGDADKRDKFEARLRESFRTYFTAADDNTRDTMRVHLDSELEDIAAERLWDTFVQFHGVTERLAHLGVLLGPATGLRLQSLVAWLLGITVFNPYEIDPEFRPEIAGHAGGPNILDLQVSPDHRTLVVGTLSQLFEGDGMGYVPAVEHITAARAMRFVAGRNDVDSEILEAALARAAAHYGSTLMDLCEEDRPMTELYRRSAGLRRLVAQASSIEGLPMGFVRSRRTIIVSPHRLRDFLGATVSAATNEQFVQATRDAFPTGQIRRIDFAALGAVGICDEVARTTGAPIEWRRPKVDTGIVEKDLDGVYLLDTPLGRRLIGEADVTSFDDLVVFIALMRYRLGPVTFADRIRAFRTHSPRNIQPSELAAIVSDTRGWIIYDDQLRNIVAALTGIDRGEAGQLVRRLSDQDPANLAELRRQFMRAAVEASTPLEVATSWYPRILRYAGRTVSRQRVIADALLVRHMVDIHRTTPAEYFAAVAPRVHDAKRREEFLQKSEDSPFSRASQVVSYEQEPSTTQAAAPGESPGGGGPPSTEGSSVKRRRKKSPSAQLGLDLGMGGEESRDNSAPQRIAPGNENKNELVNKHGNKRGAYRVVSSLAEFFPHPTASRVELAGRVRDLQTFKSSSGERVSFFVLFDSRAFVRVFIPSERVDENIVDGESVLVRGRVRVRAGKKVCDALEVKTVKGGNSDGETTPDKPPT